MKIIKTNRITLVLVMILVFMVGMYAVEELIKGLILFGAFIFFIPIILDEEEY